MGLLVTEIAPNILTLPKFPDFLDGLVDSPQIMGNLVSPSGQSLFSLAKPERLMNERLTGLPSNINNLFFLAAYLAKKGAEFLEETQGAFWGKERITCPERPEWGLTWVGMDDWDRPEHFRFCRKTDSSGVEFCYQRGLGAHNARWGIRISGAQGQVSLTDFNGPTPYSPKLSYWRHYELRLGTEVLIAGAKKFYDIPSHQTERVVWPLIRSAFDSGIVFPSNLYKVEAIGFKNGKRILRDGNMRIMDIKEVPHQKVAIKEKLIKKKLNLPRTDLPSGGQMTGFTLRTHREMSKGGSQLQVEGIMSFDRSGPLRNGFLRVSCLTPVVQNGDNIPVAQGLFGQFCQGMASAIVGIE